jgi:hypothetical protein
MRRHRWWTGALVTVILTGCGGGSGGSAKSATVAPSPSSATYSVKVSLGSFAFGPDGRLYASDCNTGLVVAVDSVDTTHPSSAVKAGRIRRSATAARPRRRPSRVRAA